MKGHLSQHECLDGQISRLFFSDKIRNWTSLLNFLTCFLFILTTFLSAPFYRRRTLTPLHFIHLFCYSTFPKNWLDCREFGFYSKIAVHSQFTATRLSTNSKNRYKWLGTNYHQIRLYHEILYHYWQQLSIIHPPKKSISGTNNSYFYEILLKQMLNSVEINCIKWAKGQTKDTPS